MIRNIVFDLGNVLLSWKPEQYLIDKGYGHEERNIILSDVFRSREWMMLDNGDLTLEEAAASIKKRSSLSYGEIISAFNSRLEILSPLHQNINLLPELKKRGYRLYFLSNFPEDIWDEVKSNNSFFSLFDGGIISAKAKLSKPDRAIYIKLAETYGLALQETLFIDDIKANVDSAVELGMKGIHLPEHTDLQKHLAEITGLA